MVTVGLLASGRGSNVKAIADHVKFGILQNVDIGVVIYSKPDARVQDVAREYEIPAEFVKHTKDTKPFREKNMLDILDSYGVDMVGLAGYESILGKEFIERYQNKILNIHPALLHSLSPFGGKGMYAMRVHRTVLSSGVKTSGPTVHLLTLAVDQGPVIDQTQVYIGDIYGMDVSFEEKAERLADRVLVYEHRLYSRVLQAMADGLVEIKTHPAIEIKESADRKKVEEQIEKTFAVTRYTREWLENWSGRQKPYLDYQAEQWKNEGKPLEKVLGLSQLL